MLCVYGNRQNLGMIRRDENALWSLGVHDLSVILYLLDEEPTEAWRTATRSSTPGVEDVVFCYLRFPSGKIAHMHLSWLDPHKMRQDHRRRPREDGRVRRHGARAQGDVYEKAPWEPAATYGEWRTRTGTIYIPKVPNDEPLELECLHFLSLVARRGRPQQGGARRARRRPDARAAPDLAYARRRRERTLGDPTAVVYPGTVLGDGVKMLRPRRRRQAAVALAALDGEARAARAARDRGRHDRLDGRDRLRRDDARRPRDRRRRARVRERCVIGDDVVDRQRHRWSRTTRRSER